MLSSQKEKNTKRVFEEHLIVFYGLIMVVIIGKTSFSIFQLYISEKSLLLANDTIYPTADTIHIYS